MQLIKCLNHLLFAIFTRQRNEIFKLKCQFLILNRNRWIHVFMLLWITINKFIMQTTIEALSPPKRPALRSKSKFKQTNSTFAETKQKGMPVFYNYLRQFPIDISEDVMNLIKNFEPVYENFKENLDKLKMYKNALGCQLEDNWVEFMTFLRNVVLKMNKRSDKIIEQKNKKIGELLKINQGLEGEIRDWKEKLQKIQNLREMQNAQLTVADAELEIVGKEMAAIYKLLESDMTKISVYLTTLEKKKQQQNQIGSNEIYNSLDKMSQTLNTMQTEQLSAGKSLETMRALIKAMAKSTKASTGTQVDESELQTKAGSIFADVNQDYELAFNTAEGSSVNVEDLSNPNHLIDKLKLKQKQHGHQKFKIDKQAQKPWALTPTLLIFLENMSKDNQSGKVLPWEYMKEIMNEIYEDRMKFQNQMTSGTIGNGMLFDEFVVFYFINKYRIRRLAEVKLLQFIVSIKYYCKFWIKAEIFCTLMDVVRYKPLFDNPQNFNYKFDYNTQNFFFTIYKKLTSFQSINEEGTVYIELKKVKRLIKVALFFTDDVNKSRIFVRLGKGIRVFEKEEYVDFDKALLLCIDEFLSVKKKNCSTLNRAFSRKFDDIQGFFTVDEMMELFEELTHIYRAGAESVQKYPIDSKLQIGKLYLYAITSNKNGYEMNANSFIQSCQRFGFDSPYPFLHNCTKGKKIQNSPVKKQQYVELKTEKKISQKIENTQQEKKQNNIKSTNQDQNSTSQGPSTNLHQQRVDISMKLFSQHFSILRELKSYVLIFTKTLKQQKNPQSLWKSFEQITKVLDKGCQFMKFPLLDKKVK